MKQYREAKAEIPEDTLLLFRLGDFYEMFFEDAERGSKAMELTLTRRAGVLMCGFPYHALDAQLPKLLSQNIKVAIAEQMEDPRFATGIVKRQITRVITPGTVMDNTVLNPLRNNFLAALAVDKKGKWALALLDISTGDFRVTWGEEYSLWRSEFIRLGVKECLISRSLEKRWLEAGYADDSNGGTDGDFTKRPVFSEPVLWTALEDYKFDFAVNQEELLKHFKVATLDGFGCRDNELAVSAAGAVLDYAANNLRQNAEHVRKLESYSVRDGLQLDAATVRNLELVENLYGKGRSGTLLEVLDRCSTPMGSRMLRDWLLRPLFDRERVIARLDAVEFLHDDPLTLAEIRELMSSIRDLERLGCKLALKTVNARDLRSLSTGLAIFPALKLLLKTFDVPLLKSLEEEISVFEELVERIDRCIVDEPPLLLGEGNIIRSGYSGVLDELRNAATEGKNWLGDIQRREQERTKIKSLKVKFNQVFGYYIEVSKSNLDLVPEDYVRKQTLVNAERFITPELKELESKILGSEEKAKALESELFEELRTFAAGFAADIQRSSAALATVDVLCSLAETARVQRYIRPKITDDDVLNIKGGKHPVLAASMGDKFVPNDVYLDNDKHRMMIITGPNMAGKSTYIRQLALLVIMAQTGSFIPAESAEIGLVDKLFTRIGASDDLMRGQSTFMVEMVETANILNGATNKSLVILDEIGRGTSTFDGLSIAWSVAEFLHDDAQSHCRTAFATHYHELTELAQTRRGVNNYNVAVREYGDRIIFLRQIVPGSADRSYGIHVAKLAGLPDAVIERAKVVLENLENHVGTPRDAVSRLPLSAVRSKCRKRGEEKYEEESSLFQPGLF